MEDVDRLLAAARRGEHRALAQFVQETQAPIWRYCAYLVGRDDADDATQETFLAAWRALPGFRGQSSAKTWLFVIARRVCLRLLRRRGRWEEIARSDPLTRPAPQPGERLELEDWLRELDLERRSAFVLTQLLGFSYSEVAEILDCPVGTVRSRVARARTELAKRWGDQHDQNASEAG